MTMDNVKARKANCDVNYPLSIVNLLASALLGVFALCSSSAIAQSYPAKAVRIIVPFAPGGPTDLQARWAGQQLNAALGQAFIIDNRGGAGGVPGTEMVVKAPA